MYRDLDADSCNARRANDALAGRVIDQLCLAFAELFEQLTKPLIAVRGLHIDIVQCQPSRHVGLCQEGFTWLSVHSCELHSLSLCFVFQTFGADHQSAPFPDSSVDRFTLLPLYGFLADKLS